MTDIINISYTVNPKVAKGRERFKNTITGEEWWGNDPNEPELDFTVAENELEFAHLENLPDADISEEPVKEKAPVLSLESVFKAMKKSKAKK